MELGHQLFSLTIVVLIGRIVLSDPPPQMYTSKFANVNVDDILRSDRLLDNYFKCLMERGSCTADGRELKKAMPDALTNECRRCTPKQKSQGEKIIKFMVENKPKMWAELKAKYDPSGIYQEKYKQVAEEKDLQAIEYKETVVEYLLYFMQKST